LTGFRRADTIARMMTLLALALGPALLIQQDDPAAVKKRILDKVAAKLASERAALLKRVEAIIDEELAKGAPQAEGENLKDLERKLRALEEQKERAADELAKAKRFAADAALRAEAKKDGPHDLEEAQSLFDEALTLHDKGKKFAESTALFKKIYYQFPKHSVGVTSAYNVACGYALWGKKEEALDWLELSVQSGFSKIDHIRADPDLDSLRNEKRYRRLLTDR
jgi:hypothetical protein